MRVRRGLGLVALATLPFVLLVRGALLAHDWLAAPGWISVGLGLLVCACALVAIGTSTWTRLRGGGARLRRARARAVAIYLVLPMLTAFAVYSLGWIAHANAKSPEIRRTWHELHPVMRLALGPARLADPELVVTGIGRRPADYDRLGLRRARRSAHYAQADGWVHAVDLRTRGRSALRNALLRAYYEVMGFDTLRHSGNADHLHVALP